jgi:hypothetical protein
MKTISKALMITAGAASLMATAPLEARYRGGHDGIDAGDVIAGALIIGGIAAIASAGSNSNRYGRDDGYGSYGRDRSYDRYDGDRYEGNRYDRSDNDRRGYGSRYAVDQCVRAAKREAGRYGWGRITDVSSINRVRGGYEVRGRLVVQTRGRDYGRGDDRGYDRRYDRGYNYDRYDDGYDKGRFTCVTRYDRVDDIRVSGLRGGY